MAELNFSALDVEESPLPEGAHPAVDRAGAHPGLVTDGRASHGDAGRPASGVGLIPGDQEGEKAAVAVQRQVTPLPAGLLPQAAHHLPYPGEGGVPAGEEPGEVVLPGEHPKPAGGSGTHLGQKAICPAQGLVLPEEGEGAELGVGVGGASGLEPGGVGPAVHQHIDAAAGGVLPHHHLSGGAGERTGRCFIRQAGKKGCQTPAQRGRLLRKQLPYGHRAAPPVPILPPL